MRSSVSRRRGIHDGCHAGRCHGSTWPLLGRRRRRDGNGSAWRVRPTSAGVHGTRRAALHGGGGHSGSSADDGLNGPHRRHGGPDGRTRHGARAAQLPNAPPAPGGHVPRRCAIRHAAAHGCADARGHAGATCGLRRGGRCLLPNEPGHGRARRAATHTWSHLAQLCRRAAAPAAEHVPSRPATGGRRAGCSRTGTHAAAAAAAMNEVSRPWRPAFSKGHGRFCDVGGASC
mmetsp:Transcript_8616/g.25438  ORF Transcript_8616/g.25438 Transcript_8616/m.25438 type:complete len:231 (+) Transcript_8616:1156-1848(+)